MSPRLEYLSAVQEQHTGKPFAEKDADRTRAQRVGRKNSSCFTYRHCPCLRSGEASSVAWELGSRALLLANEAPCPTADYQFLLAHRAYFMHCLQETPPGNLYLQGWQTAISSITGWLRETEPIKWILESTEVFTSVLSKREKKKSLQCGVYCTFQERSAYAMQNTVLCRKMPGQTWAGRGTDN